MVKMVKTFYGEPWVGTGNHVFVRIPPFYPEILKIVATLQKVRFLGFEGFGCSKWWSTLA